MLAAVYHGPRDVRVEERPRPAIADNEVLLRVAACGVCGTDQRIVAGGHRYYPEGTVRIPGHETVGEIVEIGPAVAEGLPAGPVFVAPNMGCGRCRQCISGHNNRCTQFHAIGITLDGAFAEYLRVPATAIEQGNIIPLEAGVDPAAAAMIEPLACVLRGQDVLGVTPEDSVLVIGAGPIGILHVMLARLQGARRVMVADRLPVRLEAAVALGADIAIDVTRRDLAEAVRAETHGEGADVVIVAVGSREAQLQALDLAAVGGRINFFGGLPKTDPTIPFDSNRVHYRELRVTGTTACSTLDCQRAASIANAGRLDLAALVTHRLPLSEAVSAFPEMPDERTIKTVISPG